MKIKFKPRQRRLAVGMLLTSSVSSTTSKQCFEQPAASFLVCSLIFIEYKHSDWFQKKALPDAFGSGRVFSLFCDEVSGGG